MNENSNHVYVSYSVHALPLVGRPQELCRPQLGLSCFALGNGKGEMEGAPAILIRAGPKASLVH